MELSLDKLMVVKQKLMQAAQAIEAANRTTYQAKGEMTLTLASAVVQEALNVFSYTNGDSFNPEDATTLLRRALQVLQLFASENVAIARGQVSEAMELMREP